MMAERTLDEVLKEASIFIDAGQRRAGMHSKFHRQFRREMARALTLELIEKTSDELLKLYPQDEEGRIAECEFNERRSGGGRI